MNENPETNQLDSLPIPESKSIFRRYWWALLASIIIILVGITIIIVENSKRRTNDSNGLDKDSIGSENLSKNQAKNEEKKEAFPDKQKTEIPIPSAINKQLPVCPTNLSGLFTAPIMELAKIAAITPLGNLGPASHTYPVDHNYFATYPKIAGGAPVPVYAPGDLTLYSLLTDVRSDSNGEVVNISSHVEGGICQGAVASIGAMSQISPDIEAAAVKSSQPSCSEGLKDKGETLPQHSKQCTYKTDIKVKAGQLLGWSDSNVGMTDSIEIWVFDYNRIPRIDVDFSWYNDSRYPQSICFFDLYSIELKSQYDQKFGRYDPMSNPLFVPRKGDPLCGSIVQNLKDTVQGTWFLGPKETVNESRHLSLVHENIDTSIGAISIGGTLSKTGKMHFSPRQSGALNREFSQVKADGNTYCYQDEGTIQADRWYIPGRFLFQLMDSTHLKAEYRSGKCTGKEVFESPLIYER